MKKSIKKLNIFQWVCTLWMTLVLALMAYGIIKSDIEIAANTALLAALITVTGNQVYWLIKGDVKTKIFALFTFFVFWSGIALKLASMMGA